MMMNRSDIEQLTDELIGQAVLTLLKRKAAVNSMALVTQLRVMQETEMDARRREVFPLIIAYIEAVMADKATSTPTFRYSGQMDTVRSLSGTTLKPGKGKIH
ncbi:hypothetical protein [Citrobacter amalonaticus]|uniref:hypothetical protein n=1 Tax=Citrobacter amalonaticus TaxID=35703 RepID=UPI00339C7395